MESVQKLSLLHKQLDRIRDDLYRYLPFTRKYSFSDYLSEIERYMVGGGPAGLASFKSFQNLGEFHNNIVKEFANIRVSLNLDNVDEFDIQYIPDKFKIFAAQYSKMTDEHFQNVFHDFNHPRRKELEKFLEDIDNTAVHIFPFPKDPCFLFLTYGYDIKNDALDEHHDKLVSFHDLYFDKIDDFKKNVDYSNIDSYTIDCIREEYNIFKNRMVEMIGEYDAVWNHVISSLKISSYCEVPLENVSEDETCYCCMMTREELLEDNHTTIQNTTCCNHFVCNVCVSKVKGEKGCGYCRAAHKLR